MEAQEKEVLEFTLSMEKYSGIHFDLALLIADDDFDMAVELIVNEDKRIYDALPDYPWPAVHVPINAINKEEEARKQEHNRKFRIQLGIKPI